MALSNISPTKLTNIKHTQVIKELLTAFFSFFSEKRIVHCFSKVTGLTKLLNEVMFSLLDSLMCGIVCFHIAKLKYIALSLFFCECLLFSVRLLLLRWLEKIEA